MEQEVEFHSMAFGGDAVARLEDGRTVFVPFALPGERARIRVIEEKSNYSRGQIVKLLSSSAHRVEPRCPHFGECGGCHFQHIDYAQQTLLKKDILRHQFERFAKIQSIPIMETIPSPSCWNYRNSVQFHLHPNSGKAGFQASASHRVIEIRECHLPEPPLMHTWSSLEFEPLPFLERIELRQGVEDEQMLILHSTGDVPDFETGLPISAVLQRGDHSMVLAGDETLPMQVKERMFSVSAGSFFQVNSSQAAAMADHLLASVHVDPSTILMDLYCGVGLFSAFFASRIQRCIAVEASPSACNDFAVNLDDFDNVELYEGLAEDVLPKLETKPQVVIADPPRAGFHPKALEALLALTPRTIAYISCDPSTLARDARKFLESGYQLQQVTPFDQFPQTYHIESISIFNLEK